MKITKYCVDLGPISYQRIGDVSVLRIGRVFRERVGPLVMWRIQEK